MSAPETFVLPEPDEYGNVTIAADALPAGSIGRRLAQLWRHHAENAACWCAPTVTKAPDGTTFVAHHVIAEQREDG